MMTPKQFAVGYITRWEDGNQIDPVKTHSMDRNDAGNWTGAKPGVGALSGSNHGVTPQALAKHRGVPVEAITFAIMHALTLAEAADIALADYFIGNGLANLAWNPVVASAWDFGYTAGAQTAVMKLQHMIGAGEDGAIGKGGETATRFAAWLANRTMGQAATLWASVRIAHYESVIASKPADAKYRNGWRNRTLYFTPDQPEGWWKRFNA